MPAYRLRIELPDQPGSLARVTGDIAAGAANIVSLDVHEVDGVTAIDEIVVEADDAWSPSGLAAALASSGNGALLSSRRVVTDKDAVTGALVAALGMVASDPTSIDDACRQALRAFAHGSAVSLVGVEDAAQDPAAAMAVERGTSIVLRDQDSGWVLAALDDSFEPHSVALIRRALNVRFSATEVGRVEALLKIRRQVLGVGAASAR